MATDIYTKAHLTVIATCLLVIAFQIGTPMANAEGVEVQKVAICDPITDRCARVGSVKEGTKEQVEALLTVTVR